MSDVKEKTLILSPLRWHHDVGEVMGAWGVPFTFSLRGGDWQSPSLILSNKKLMPHKGFSRIYIFLHTKEQNSHCNLTLGRGFRFSRGKKTGCITIVHYRGRRRVALVMAESV